MAFFRTTTYGHKKNPTIFVFMGLGKSSFFRWFLGNVFSSHGYQAVVYSHDVAILSSDPRTTRQNFLEIKQDVLKRVKKLRKKDQKNLAVFATGIGNIPAFMIANELSGVKKVITNTPMADLAETVWTWEKDKLNYKEMLKEKRITKKQLKQEWFELSPLNNIDTFAEKKVLLYAAKNDEIIPFKQTQKLLDRMKEDHIDFEAIINSRHKHLISSLITLLKFGTYTQFLNKK